CFVVDFIMNDVLIPEVIRNKLPKEDTRQNINISLSQKIDRRINTYNNSYTQNNTQINNTQPRQKGFWAMIFSLIFLPITLPYSIIKNLYIKYDVKNKLEEEKIKIQKSKWVNKYITGTEQTYDFEEIY